MSTVFALPVVDEPSADDEPCVRRGFVKERMYVGEAIIATCFGIAFSCVPLSLLRCAQERPLTRCARARRGYAAGIFAPRTWAEGASSSLSPTTLALSH